jgi:hypothetical protein
VTLTLTDMRDLGVLVTCAMRPKLRPATDPHYRKLLGRYRSEPEFRNAARSLFDGMDILVLSETAELGLIVGPRRESLFAYRLSDLPNVTGVEQRLVVGLITAAVAAYAFPAPDAFDDERVHYVTVTHLERFLRETCEAFKREAEPAVDDEALEEAWRLYERMPPVHRPRSGRTAGRLSPTCAAYWINLVLEWLTNQGLAKQVTNQGPGTYQLLERFRVQVRELSGHEAYKMLAVARGNDAEHDSTISPDPADLDPNLSDEPAAADAPAVIELYEFHDWIDPTRGTI